MIVFLFIYGLYFIFEIDENILLNKYIINVFNILK